MLYNIFDLRAPAHMLQNGNSTKIYYEPYKYVHPPEWDHSPNDVIESRYKTVDSLADKFVVYAHGVGYRVYMNCDDFMKDLAQMDEQDRVFHEVIFSVPQKLKFDIDAPIGELANFTIPTCEEDTPENIPGFEFDDPEINALLATFTCNVSICEERLPENEIKYRNILETILSAVRDAFFITYGIDLRSSDIVICESKSDNSSAVKYSNHIILDNFYVRNHEQAREFTRRVAALLPECYRRYLDVSVNKRLQNFRMVNCHKTCDLRTKKIITGQEDSRAVITNIGGCARLVDIALGETHHNNREDLHPEDTAAILELCKQDKCTHAHRFKFVRNNVFIFARIHPSECEFCNRVHDSDNTLIVTTRVTNGVIAVFKQCRKYLDEKKKDGNHIAKIGEIQSSSAQMEINSEAEQKQQEEKIANWTDQMVLRSVKALADGELYPSKSLFDSLPRGCKNVYVDEKLTPFELTDTLVVRAAMKMGKTKALKSYINQYFSSGLKPAIIRFVSFRQTFSGNIKEKFGDFTLYSDVKGPLSAAKLIVQVESLYRLDIQEGVEAPDLLILDECESIFEQFDSGLLRGNFNECFAKFQYLVRYSKHVVCMDANVSDRTYRILLQMRPSFRAAISSENQVVYHHNRYKNATNDKYFIGGDKLKWLGLLYSSIEADEKVAVPMSSLTEAKIIVKNLSRKYPTKNIKLYSSETTNSEKREHFADVNTYWSQYDVLVYTPTVSAGVSFEEKHFNKVFGYFTDQSCPVETCQQMIGRIRDVSDHAFYICLAASGNNLPADIESLKQHLYNKRENLVRRFDETGLRSEYGEHGEIVYHAGDYFQMWLENNCVRNMSKNSFVRRFVHIVSISGAQVEFISDEVFELGTGISFTVGGELNDEIAEIRRVHFETRGEIRAESSKKIAAAPDLTEAEVEDIHALIVAQKDITEEQRCAFEKHRLRVDYRYEGDIDEKFVDKYRDPKTRRMFKNITRMCAHETVEGAWEQIQAEERANHRYLMDLGERGGNQDLNRKYVFDQHRYALGLLKLCGWKNINDPQFIHQVLLAQNLRQSEKLYWDSIRPACVEFGIKTPSLQAAQLQRGNDDAYVKYLLKPVNKIISTMYGISIVSRKKDPHMFLLNHNRLFTLNPETSRAKNIPLLQPVALQPVMPRQPAHAVAAESASQGSQNIEDMFI